MNLKPVIGIEIKFNSSPKFSVGNEISLKDLGLNKCFIVVPEVERYYLKDSIEVISISELIMDFVSGKLP
jgi:hypothetical protein